MRDVTHDTIGAGNHSNPELPFAAIEPMPPSASRHRQLILTALRNWLRTRSEYPVVRILEGKRPATEYPVYFKEEPRIVIALQGTGRYITMENGREVAFDLNPSQALFLAPCTWSCPVPRSAYRSLAITLRADSTRITVHSRLAACGDGKIPWQYLAQWQASATLGDRSKHLIALLNDPAPAHTGDQMYAMVINIMIAEIVGLVESAPESTAASGTLLWHSLCDYVSEHWSDPSLSRESIAKFFNRHPNHVSRFFHAHARQNFRSYLNEIRLKRSVQFLRDMRYNVTDVAHLCGFCDLQYFIRCFRLRFGITPGEYRNRPMDGPPLTRHNAEH